MSRGDGRPVSRGDGRPVSRGDGAGGSSFATTRRTSRDTMSPAQWTEWHESAFTTDSAPPLQPHPIALADEGGAGSHTLRLLCAGLHGCGSAITCVRLELHTGEEGTPQSRPSSGLGP